MSISVDQLKESLPSNLQTFATQELATKLDQITTDPLYAENIKQNFISYTGVLQDGKYKTEDYLNAVAYVSFKLMGYSNQEAYFRTFPDRQAKLIGQGRTPKEIASYVAAYHRNQLVNKIMEQSLIPSWVLNQDAYQKAINTQVRLMTEAKSERVQAMAADSILNHLKKPETEAPLINIDMRKGSGLDELKEALTSLAQKQKELIVNNTITVKDIVEQDIMKKDE